MRSPTMEMISNKGRTSIVYRIGLGRAGKMPRDMDLELPGLEEFAIEIDNAFDVEKKLLERLGNHPRIVRSVIIS
jgi:hypothetical protein